MGIPSDMRFFSGWRVFSNLRVSYARIGSVHARAWPFFYNLRIFQWDISSEVLWRRIFSLATNPADLDTLKTVITNIPNYSKSSLQNRALKFWVFDKTVDLVLKSSTGWFIVFNYLIPLRERLWFLLRFIQCLPTSTCPILFLKSFRLMIHFISLIFWSSRFVRIINWTRIILK